ncbi:MAG: glucose-1-phosphate cytidylyltransferase [Cyclobacteriaceae bacterium]
MKVVILAGGLGTRLSEETGLKPKPMVEIGGKPILWHIMKIYSQFGYNEFIVCLGYKGYFVKEYFFNYYKHLSDFTINLENNELEIHNSKAEPWKITLVDTGGETMTGGRVKRIQQFVGDETFMLTYGDGVAKVDIDMLVKFHKEKKADLTVTAVQPSGRFGALRIDEFESVNSFIEKPKGDGAWINGGFFVCEPSVFDYIDDDRTVWERDPMERMAKAGRMAAFKHKEFWKPMDTLRDRFELEQLWESGNAPWKIWKE